MERKTFSFNKLVRDGIIDLFQKEDSIVTWHPIQEKELFTKALLKKIEEELQEVFAAKNREELIEELGDLEEILCAFKAEYEITQTQVDEARLAKRAKRGGYEGKRFIENVDRIVGIATYKCAIKNNYAQVNYISSTNSSSDILQE